MGRRMTKAEETLCSPKGAELHTASYFHPRSRAIVVVAHSLAGRIGQCKALVQALWDAEFSVYLYDWRHQRMNSCQKMQKSVLSAVEAKEDFELVMQQAQGREMEKRVFVVAHDEAASVCLSYCASCSNVRIAGVVLFTPRLNAPSAGRCTSWTASLLSVLWPRWRITVTRSNGRLEEMTYHRYRLHLQLAQETTTKLASVITPLLVMHGREDNADDALGCYLVDRRVNCSDKNVFEFPGASSDVWLSNRASSNSAIAVEKVVQWLTERVKCGE